MYLFLLKKIKFEFKVFFPFFFAIQLSLVILCCCQLFSWWVYFYLFFYFICLLSVCFSLFCCLYFMFRIVCQPFGFFPTFYFTFVDSLVLLFCCQSQNKCETSVSCGFTLFCTTFFFYVFVCYKLSWFISPYRFFKGVCIIKHEK